MADSQPSGRIIADMHIWPDGEDHIDSRYCWCQPRLHWEGITVVVIHRDVDGHELFQGLTLQ